VIKSPKPRIRLEDLARDLNVSVMTVSKVVRGCPDVGPATRSRVFARIDQLHYQPDWMARSLAMGRTFMIGLIVPDLMYFSFAEIAKAVAGTVRPLGYDVLICCPNEDARLEASEIDHLLARRVDGLILASAQPPESSSVFERIEARKAPYVLIDRSYPETHAPYVGVQDEAIGRLATSHLIECECRRVAHISGPPAAIEAGRLKGYRQTLRAAGISVPESYVTHAVDEKNSYEVTRRLLSLKPQPDGIFVYNDGAAARAIGAILDAGMCIPEQIKVIGVGNAPYSHLLRVPLSTIDQSSGLAGQCAAETLISLMTSKNTPVQSVVIEPTLIARESTTRSNAPFRRHHAVRNPGSFKSEARRRGVSPSEFIARDTA
jgi:LacI family transcriptional regulator